MIGDTHLVVGQAILPAARYRVLSGPAVAHALVRAAPRLVSALGPARKTHPSRDRQGAVP